MAAWTLLSASVAVGSFVFYNRVVSLLFVTLLVVGVLVFRLRSRLAATLQH
jgi:hypothetical protein